MDSCPLALCIWHTAVRPGRSPGWHGAQTEHPLQRRLQGEEEEAGLSHNRDSRSQLTLGCPPLSASQILREGRNP